MLSALLRPFLNNFTGSVGKQATRFGLWMHLEASVYQRLHNVIVPAEHGTTQVDHVLVSPFGIFVVETKTMDGWIFGNERDSQWTQVFKTGGKFRFQNPLRQNYRHTQCLAQFLQIDPSLFHSVVFFIGEAELKTPMPPNVMTSGLASYIRGFTEERLNKYDIAGIMGRLSATRTDPALTKRNHVQALKVRYSSTKTCPKCAGELVERTATRGRNSGRRFLACKNFPKCWFTKEVA